MNRQQKKEVLKCLNLIQDRMSQTIVLFGFKQNIISTAEKINLQLNEMVIER